MNFPEALSIEELKLVFGNLFLHHDALRIVIKKDGAYLVQVNMRGDFPLWIREKDLREAPNALELLNAESADIQAGIDLYKGPLMKLGLFHMKDGTRLVIVVHHLVIDGVSWRILFEDIESLMGQLKNGEQLSLPAKTDPFLSWSDKLEEYTKTKYFPQGNGILGEFSKTQSDSHTKRLLRRRKPPKR